MKGALVKGFSFLLLFLILVLSQPVLAPEIGRWRAYVAEQPDEDAGNVRYVTVVDGDTVRLENGTYVRLVGYDAYELSEPKGPEAKQALENLCRRYCNLNIDDLEPFDKYGRKLGYLWCLDFIFLPDPPIWPVGMSHYINVNKWFLTDGKEYIKRELYIHPDEHPWWTWLTRHQVVFKGLNPS